MTITLSAAQLKEMKDLNKLGTYDPNYAGMYQYIYDHFHDQMPDDQAYWFSPRRVD